MEKENRTSSNLRKMFALWGVVQYNEELAAEITLVPYILDAFRHLCVKTGKIDVV